MEVPDFVKRRLTQDMVYWRMAGNDGEGGFLYDDPVELKCRWEEKIEQVVTTMGEETVSRAKVFVDRKLTEGSYIYLGTLDDSTIGNDLKPESTEGSMRILSTSAIPSVDGRTVVYMVYANM